ncbi:MULTISPECIES: N-acyl homoserine lactonase family protein [Thiomicrorhabdus]|uniref:N-acyl homoserine lactonase family protein n=1 Tax=Thiomicrorhabdus xiamenensis TaxID=2739063 RepID=A0A7D4SIH2_9GAMM|nr:MULTISPECIES: N-acyl homoserine lactonase family protein [Thiomicrorhabdus]MBO1923755.1 N-acyl homoserine lactonase family protein [Thiomicrorhabdus sp. 6S3-12]QKI88619.1 N-acyl homoserine lactonase family protein [Thiomicrorhabdus xiamenensis]
MTQVKKFWSILTGEHTYEKTLSTRGRGQGEIIKAPILAYLIETDNGRILFDVGCDYQKIKQPDLRAKYYEHDGFPFGPPDMTEEQRLPNKLQILGLQPEDIDMVFCSHLHFDHAGGLCEFCGAEVHVHQREMKAAKEPADDAYFASDFELPVNWKIQTGEYELVPGVNAIETPGHTAGHMSMMIEMPKGPPIILAGDAADLTENIRDEVAPGLCWQDNEALAIDSIRKLKSLSEKEKADLWPNHDWQFYLKTNRFPNYFE